ncbi:MAG: TlpA family protein disulfide reductase [Devosiaceae bacterium]
MSSPQNPDSQPAKTGSGKMRLSVLLLVAAILGITSGGLAVYLNNANPDNDETAATCTLSDERRAALNAAAQGQVAAFAVVDDARPAPMMAFVDGDGTPRTMDDWAGSTVLFNLWATWCAPCREEMPALDRLQANMGGRTFEVVAVNIDTRESADPQGFLDEIEVAALSFYQDSTADLFQDLRAEGLAFGMPTTLLIDSDGCLQGFLAGAAHWDHADAVALVNAARVP